MTELWKDIPFYDRCQVSSRGNVRFIPPHESGWVDANFAIHDGAVYVGLYCSTTSYDVELRVDKLVAAAFCDNPDGAVEVIHLDGDLQNCEAKNLMFWDPEPIKGRAPIIAIDVYSFEKTWFPSASAACRALRVHASDVSAVLHGKYSKIGRWRFRYAFTMESDVHTTEARPVVAVEKATGHKSLFQSQSEAARSLGLKQSHISRVLKGDLRTTGGYYFYYLNKIDGLDSD